MASPKLEVFFIYDSTTGAPKTGVTPTFSTYKNDLGANVTPQPTISEIGGGAYAFTPVFTDPARGIVYQVATGNSPPYWARYMRPEDWAADDVSTVLKHQLCDEEFVTTGPDAGRVVRRDGTDHATVLAKWDMLEADGTTKSLDGNLVFLRKKT